MAKKVRNDASGGEKQAAHPKPRAQNYKLPKLHAKRNEDVIDERLVDRVRQFMATTGGSENIVTTLQYLRTNYGEYRSKPLRAFKETVLRVINIVNNEKVKEGLILNTDNEVNSDFGESFSEASSSSDEEEVEEEPKRNTFNKIILNNYKKIQEAKKQQQEQQQQQQNTNDAESKEQPQPQPQQVDAVPSPSPQFLLPSADASASTSAPTESNGNTTEKKSKNSEMDDKQKNKRKTEESAAPSDEAENSKRPSKKGKKGRDGREPSTPNGQNSGYLVINKPVARYSDLGGIESILQDVRELVEWPLTHPEIYAWMGVEPPRGILLHGPPGCGKTLLACAIAGEVGVPFFKISAPEIVSGMSGESEAKLRDLFKDATKNAPSLIFIDEIDAITPKRETAQREMERRIVAQLLTCMDELTMEKTGNKSVIVIGATNRPDSLDPALRRAGRFDREISLGIPDEKARANILRVMSTKLRLSGDFDFDVIAKKTPGFVGADLNALTKEAAVIAMNRIFNNLFKNAQKHTPSTQVEEVSNDKNVDQMEVDSGDSGSDKAKTEAFDSNNIFTESSNRIFSKGPSTNLDTRLAISTRLKEFSKPLTPEQLAPLSITMADFEEAITKVQPSSKREGFATIPDVTWKDIGALEDIRQELNLSITEPIKTPERFTNMGLSAPVGVLLYGPPGCGKTLLAKAISNESGANFISIKGPELLNKYVGESERAVRQVFARGRASAPCVIFFDELDALCPRRGSDSSNASSERVVNQLLTEMDGLESRKQVFVIAATNRPDMIDPAMLRPGRLDKLLYVPLPDAASRLSILTTITRQKKTPLDSDVDLKEVANDQRCEGFSGADLEALVREAAVTALKEGIILEQERDRQKNAENVNNNDENAKDSDAKGNSSSSSSNTNNTKKDLIICKVAKKHFEIAFTKVKPSVSPKDRQMYQSLQTMLRNYVASSS